MKLHCRKQRWSMQGIKVPFVDFIIVLVVHLRLQSFIKELLDDEFHLRPIQDSHLLCFVTGSKHH